MHPSGEWIMRLPREDFCQAKGVPSHLKYESEGGPGIADLAAVLQGSIHVEKDLTTLLKTQLLFWMLAAPDGYAKNFSIRMLPLGRYALNPIYDVMSIWPIEGNGANQFSWFKAKMAMAVFGKNKHYHFKDIERRHFNAMAAKCFGRNDAEGVIEGVLSEVSTAINTVASKLPIGFAERVADTVFGGLVRAAEQLDRMKKADRWAAQLSSG